jgi:hypothetical protein
MRPEHRPHPRRLARIEWFRGIKYFAKLMEWVIADRERSPLSSVTRKCRSASASADFPNIFFRYVAYRTQLHRCHDKVCPSPHGPRLISVMRTPNRAPALLQHGREMRMTRRIFSATQDTKEILVDRARLLRAQAQRMPPGVEHDRLIKQAREIEGEAHANEWAFSPGLRPPT